VRTRTMISHL